jgi:1-acyl-sn-glycerol-3-phosphate acyltransferase
MCDDVSVGNHSSRWRKVARRLVAVPCVVVVAVVAVIGLPLWLLLAAVVDVVTGRAGRWSTVRLLVALTAYLVMLAAGQVIFGLLWCWYGFGRRLDGPASQDAHWRLMAWWLARVAGLLRRLLGVRWTIDGRDDLLPGPVVVLARHVSVLDAFFSAALLQLEVPLRPRIVLMRELVVEPNIDVAAHRLPHHFVDRTNTAGQIDAIGRLASGLGAGDAALIFPEGGLSRPERLARALARLAKSDPDRYERVRGLRHLLPVRPGGSLAMLEAAPEADVAFVGHVGFEQLTDPASIWRAVPARRPVRARVWRVPRSSVPTDRRELAAWLDAQWQQVDDWIDVEPGDGAPAPSPAAARES